MVGVHDEQLAVTPQGRVGIAPVLRQDREVEECGALLGVEARRGLVDDDQARIADQGLGDVLQIGTQERPDLFDLRIERPSPLAQWNVEWAGRVSAQGEAVSAFDEADLEKRLRRVRASGAESVAVTGMHAYAFPEVEQRVRRVAEACGFEDVVCSHQIAREMGFLARAETTVADAYLTPLLQNHVGVMATALPEADLLFMQSSGGLIDASGFRGPRALLSGPAGGVVAGCFADACDWRIPTIPELKGIVDYDVPGCGEGRSCTSMCRSLARAASGPCISAVFRSGGSDRLRPPPPTTARCR